MEKQNETKLVVPGKALSSKTLPDVILREALKNMEFSDILRQCSLSSAHNRICRDDQFWKQYFSSLSGEGFYQVLDSVIRKGITRFVKIIMEIEPNVKHEALKKKAAERALAFYYTLNEELMWYFIGLPADQFINKPQSLQWILDYRLSNPRLTGLTNAFQRHIIELPADQFTNKPAALQRLLSYRVSGLSETNQLYIIDLSADQFEDKPEALQFLLTREMSRLSETTQRYIIDLRADKFTDKPAALQFLLSFGLSRLSETNQRYIIDWPADQFKDKPKALQVLLTHRLSGLSETNQQYIIDLPSDKFIDKPGALRVFKRIYQVL